MPKVSVIIPNYNHEKWLKLRIDSILNQTYQDFEIIILDDCSTDKSAEIIESYRYNPKVSAIIFNTVNSGSPFMQWNKGIGISSGDYIWIAESDDYADTTFLGDLLKPLENDEKTGVSYCQSWRVDQNGNILFSCGEWLSDRWKTDFHNSGLDEFFEYGIYSHGIFNASAVVFRKATFKKISAEFLKYSYVGDEILWAEMLWHGNISYNSRNLNFFRTHQSNTSIKMMKEGNRILEGYKCLQYFNSKYYCIKKKTFQKKLNYLAGLWAKDLFESNLEKNINQNILKHAAKIDILLFLRLPYYFSVQIKKRIKQKIWRKRL